MVINASCSCRGCRISGRCLRDARPAQLRDRAMDMFWILIAVLTVLVAMVVLSYIVEALRSVPKRPETLVWAPRVPIECVDLGGMRVRCIRTGVGPNLVLLHTLRTQLDIFEKIIPELEKRFTVHAFDYPGHGWSDIPKAAYAPEDFYQWTAAYLDRIDIRQATSSSGRESHPSALTEPDVKLAPHPAPTLQPPVARRAATGRTDWGPVARCFPASASMLVPGV